MSSMSTGSKLSHLEYSESKLKPENIMAVVCGKHKCSNMFDDGGEQVPCNHQLWARQTPDAVEALTRHLTRFLALPQQTRGEIAAQGISFPPATHLHGQTEGEKIVSKGQPIFKIGINGGLQRCVCRCVFTQHYGMGIATLTRIICKTRNGKPIYGDKSQMKVDARKSIVPSAKSAHAIAWWLTYAEETSEKLPDIDRLLTPHRYLRDIYDVCCTP